MTDYTREVFEEIAPPENDCCRVAYLSAVIHTAAVLELERGERRLVFTRRGLKAKLDAPLSAMFGMTADEDGIRGQVLPLLAELGILETTDGGLVTVKKGIDRHLVMADCCRAAYVAGAYLGCGGMTVAPGNNRLRFSVNYAEMAEDLSSLLGRLGVASFISEHKDKYEVCVKRAQSIGDCLVLMGAPAAMLAFTSDSAISEVRADLNRVNNIEVANIGKTVSASMRQIGAVRRILEVGGLDSLDPKLRETALIRLESEFYTYGDMAARLGVSKGSVKYRLKKLVELGESYGAAGNAEGKAAEAGGKS